MQKNILAILLICNLVCGCSSLLNTPKENEPIFSIPEFNGFRDDDEQNFHHPESSISVKNINSRIKNIEDINISNDEIIIRIYDYFNGMILVDGGHSGRLREFRLTQNSITLLLFPPCNEGPIKSRNNTAIHIGKTLLENDIFTIPDWRSYPDYPTIVDGNSYHIQIQNASAFREFSMIGPNHYSSDGNERFLNILRALSDAFSFNYATCSRTRI